MAETSAPFPSIEPVAVALDHIEVGPHVCFAGLDLETGTRVRVSIEQVTSHQRSGPIAKTLQAQGLLLLLSVQQIRADT